MNICFTFKNYKEISSTFSNIDKQRKSGVKLSFNIPAYNLEKNVHNGKEKEMKNIRNFYIK